MERHIDVGVTKFQLWFADFPDASRRELFAGEVMPEFAEGRSGQLPVSDRGFLSVDLAVYADITL